jgi:methylase of polypeptide subunit release factors
MSDERDIQARITGFWSAVAGDYEGHRGNVPARDSAEYAEWAKTVAALLPPPPADILDMATGTGFIAMLAAAQNHRVTAIDLSQAMLDVASAAAQA